MNLEDAIKEVDWLRKSLQSSWARMEQFAGSEADEVKRLQRQHQALEVVLNALKERGAVANNVEAPFTVEQVANSIRHQAVSMYRDGNGNPMLLTRDGWVHALGGTIVQTWSPRERVEPCSGTGQKG